MDLKNLDGTQYEREEGDQLVLTVKRDANTEEALIQLSADADCTFYFTPSATDGMDYGTYKYDIQLTTAQGEVYTVIPVSTFVVMEEVTWSANAAE
ncbi:MAG: hypothetical protein IJR41_04650 [Atopobiaceae bacterium]|nr:hypothetical protein [Atopobiaceae bacterium]